MNSIMTGQSEPSARPLATPPRILMLVPHEPYIDPRVVFATELCAELGRTDVIGWSTRLEQICVREFDGTVYTEIVNLTHVIRSEAYRRKTEDLFPYDGHLRLMKALSRLRGLLPWRPVSDLLYKMALKRDGPLPACHAGAWKEIGWFPAGLQVLRVWRERPEVVEKFIDDLTWWNLIVETLYLRGRATSVRPRFILCHDVYALIAAVRLKKILKCPVVYDSHELWSEGKNDAEWWQVEALAWLEAQAIRHADHVITVSPFIAEFIEKFFKLRSVSWVPNAEPLRYSGTRSFQRPPNQPVRFVFQGLVSPGRGVDTFLEAWEKIGEPRATFAIRAPENAFLTGLRDRYAHLMADGRLEFAPEVPVDQVVEKASHCDVGVIPYAGPNRNHIWACPNKLSQYMQAGVAILHHRDEVYVTDVVNHHGCGHSFDPTDLEGLRKVVSTFVADPDALQDMKKRAWEGARTSFNWETHSAEYRRVLEEMFRRGETAL